MYSGVSFEGTRYHRRGPVWAQAPNHEVGKHHALLAPNSTPVDRNSTFGIKVH